MKKFYILLISGLLVFAGLPVRALAAENGAFLEGYASEEGKLKVYCSDIVPEEETAAGAGRRDTFHVWRTYPAPWERSRWRRQRRRCSRWWTA